MQSEQEKNIMMWTAIIAVMIFIVLIWILSLNQSKISNSSEQGGSKLQEIISGAKKQFKEISGTYKEINESTKEEITGEIGAIEEAHLDTDSPVDESAAPTNESEEKNKTKFEFNP